MDGPVATFPEPRGHDTPETFGVSCHETTPRIKATEGYVKEA
jgi:hypothetical protein